MSVFVDTSAILEIFDARDPRNHNASRVWTSIVRSPEEIIMSNYVLLEAVSLLQNRFGIPAAQAFVEDMVPAVALVWVDRSLHEAASTALLVGPGKSSPSLVDCVSFEVIRLHV